MLRLNEISLNIKIKPNGSTGQNGQIAQQNVTVELNYEEDDALKTVNVKDKIQNSKNAIHYHVVITVYKLHLIV